MSSVDLPETSLMRLRGQVVFNQGSRAIMCARSDFDFRWHPGPTATLRYADGSDEEAEVAEPMKRPKRVPAGKELFVTVDRATDEPHAELICIALVNDGAPLEVWCADALKALERKAMRRARAAAKKADTSP